jgi:hypothetical protein
MISGSQGIEESESRKCSTRGSIVKVCKIPTVKDFPRSTNGNRLICFSAPRISTKRPVLNASPTGSLNELSQD